MTRFVSQNQISIRDDSIAAITAMIIVHRAQQNLHHCQKSTLSRNYRLTRLHVCLIDCIDRLDWSRLCQSTRLQRLSIDSIDFKVYCSGVSICLSDPVPPVGVLLNCLNVVSCQQCHTVLYFSDANLCKIQLVSPQWGR